MKTCTNCGETKPLTEFHKSSKSKDGHRTWCKPCRSDKARLRTYEIKENDLKWINSTNNCQICDVEVKGRNKHLDHCHQNGEVRGILCVDCNHGITLIDRGLLNNAINYLTKRVIKGTL